MEFFSIDYVCYTKKLLKTSLTTQRRQDLCSFRLIIRVRIQIVVRCEHRDKIIFPTLVVKYFVFEISQKFIYVGLCKVF